MKFYRQSIYNVSEKKYEAALSFLAAGRRERFLSLYSPEDRKRSILGDMLARCALGEELGVHSGDIRIEEADGGKPYAPGFPLEFSISHSGSFAVCVTHTAPVGVDAELIRPVSVRLARRVFCDADLDCIMSSVRASDGMITEMRSLRRFFELWTAKEAADKCSGTGVIKFRTPVASCFHRSFFDSACGKTDEYIVSVYPVPDVGEEPIIK